MGLDQAILIGPKGERPEGALMVFRKHDRLHGFMERLSYQKGLLDPFDQVEVDWDEIEQRVYEEVHTQLGREGLLKSNISEMAEIELSDKPSEDLIYIPSFDFSEYTKGRLGSDHLMLLTEEDFGYLIKAFVEFSEASSEQERDKIFPPCKGFFFGESTEEEWAKTTMVLHLIFNQFGFDDYDYYYHSEW